jgi:hypothetical protein
MMTRALLLHSPVDNPPHVIRPDHAGAPGSDGSIGAGARASVETTKEAITNARTKRPIARAYRWRLSPTLDDDPE